MDSKSRLQDESSAPCLGNPPTPAEKHITPLYHLHTLYLFSKNNIKCVTIPQTLFALFTVLSGPVLTTNAAPTLLFTLSRLPILLLWISINLLICDISNQRLPSSILEDSLNKSWRPIPAGRITPDTARRVLIALLPLSLLLSKYLGNVQETMAVMVMAWVYNDLEAANENFHLRNVANALGIAAFNAGSTIAITGTASGLNVKGYIWLCILGVVIYSTISVLDMPDIAGDSARGRRTMPIVYGHEVARWGIAVPVVLLSVVCPIFLDTGIAGFSFSVALGSILACHFLVFRTHAADKTSEKMWCVWTMALYCLPLFANGEVFIRLWEGTTLL